MLFVRIPEKPETFTLLYGPTRIVSGFPPAFHAARMIAFTFASVTVAVEVQSTGAVVPVPVTKPVVPLLDAIEVWLDAIHDSSEADTRATAVPPAPTEAIPLFWLAAASM